MNNLFKNFMSSGGRKEIALDSGFSFQCAKCGDCCKNNATVVLNGYDFLRIAEHLHMPAEEMFRQHMDLTHLEMSNFPLMVIKSQATGSACRFCLDGKCSIYKARPFICRLYPIGYTLDSDALAYFQVQGCRQLANGEEQTLDQYLEFAAGAQELERQRSFLVLTQKVFAVENLISDDVAIEDLQVLYGEVFALTYLDYDSSGNYDKVFRKNTGKILHSLNYVAQTGRLPDYMRE